MLDANKIIKVVNRDNGTVGYSVPDLGNLHRNFQPREEKNIPMEELRKLSYLPGGDTILRECLIIRDEEAIAELLGNVEPEYFYTEKDVKELLERGSIEQLMDCLDFAPMGVIDLVKSLAVKCEVNDIRKRNLIKERTGFDVSKAIEINHETAEDVQVEEKTRRAAPIKKEAVNGGDTPVRRTTPKYTIKK